MPHFVRARNARLHTTRECRSGSRQAGFERISVRSMFDTRTPLERFDASDFHEIINY